MSAPPDAPPDIAGPDSDAKETGGSGLTFPQIAAGALAAATASILGSFLGVLGTIGGAAAASIVSTVGAALYQRSLERTRDKVKERLVVSPAGTQVAAAVARVTGQGRPGEAGTAGRSGPGGGRPWSPGAPSVGGAPTRVAAGNAGPRPPGAGPPRRGLSGEHAGRGRSLPPEQQLRAGGRTVATQSYAQGVPTRGGPATRAPQGQGRIPSARTTGTPPGGIPPTARMTPPGPGGPPGPGRPGAPGGPIGGDDAATQLTHVVHQGEERPRRLGKRAWFTMAGVAVSVFVIGILASFGVESAAGRPLSGGSSGTSVGSLFGQSTGTATATSEPSSTETPSSGSEETTTSPADDPRSGSQESTGSNQDQDGSSPQTEQRRSSSPDSGSDNSGSTGGGGLAPSLLPRIGAGGSTNG